MTYNDSYDHDHDHEHEHEHDRLLFLYYFLFGGIINYVGLHCIALCYIPIISIIILVENASGKLLNSHIKLFEIDLHGPNSIWCHTFCCNL